MALIRIHAGRTTKCGTGDFVLDYSVDGAPVEAVLLKVVREASPGQAADAINKTGLSQLTVAALPEAVVVTVHPASGAFFANGVQVALQVTLKVDGQQVAQYGLPLTDVSGTPSTALLLIRPQAGFNELVVPEAASVSPQPVTPPEPKVPPGEPQSARQPGVQSVAVPPQPARPVVDGGALMREATYAARRRSGVAKLQETQQSRLFIAVDRSASFLTAVRDGAAQVVLELLLGVNDVVGTDTHVPVYEAATVPEGNHHPALSTQNLTDYWESQLGHAAHTGGVLLAPLVDAIASTTEVRTVVIVTDGLPPDLPELAEALRTSRSKGRRGRVHVLALARSVSDPEVRRQAWRDELAPLAALRDEGLLTYSSISPESEAGWLRTRLADQVRLDEVVSGLPFWEANA